jgi:hypothetical protein
MAKYRLSQNDKTGDIWGNVIGTYRWPLSENLTRGGGFPRPYQKRFPRTKGQEKDLADLRRRIGTAPSYAGEPKRAPDYRSQLGDLWVIDCGAEELGVDGVPGAGLYLRPMTGPNAGRLVCLSDMEDDDAG